MIDRRHFLRAASASAVAGAQMPLTGALARPAAVSDLADCPLDVVDITAGSMPAARMTVNTRFLLSLDLDRLLFSFRTYAGLPTRGAKPYGGWEAPEMGFHGQFVGHYLSAVAKAAITMRPLNPAAATACRDTARQLVIELAACQRAIATLRGEGAPGHPGYLNAQSPAQFDRLERLEQCDVPYYVVQKIMAGLIDAHLLLGDAAALKVARGMADYFGWRMARLSPERIAAMTETRRRLGPQKTYFMESGAMQDTLLRLYDTTGDPAHQRIAAAFDRPWFRHMLAADDDRLGNFGEHANTEIANTLGLARAADQGGSPEYRLAATNFLEWMRDGHQFVTGGVSGRSDYAAPLDYGSELFSSRGKLARQLLVPPVHGKQECGESCCSHHLNRLTRSVFNWTRDALWADEHERRFVNAVLGQQHPDSGMLVYNLNLLPGSRKTFGTPDATFWCCYGSGVEAFASLGEGAYHHDHDKGIWASNYLPSTLRWKPLGLTLTQETDFPRSGRIVFLVQLERPTRFALNLRIPSWAQGAVALVNGRLVGDTAVPGTFLALDRIWRNGDAVTLELPFRVIAEVIGDQPDHIALRHGPQVLVAVGNAPARFEGGAADLVAALRPKGDGEFTVTSGAGTITLQPLNRVVDQHYTAYIGLSQGPPERVHDAILIGEPASEAAHNLRADGAQRGTYRNRPWIEPGTAGAALRLAVASNRQTYLRTSYWGGDTGGGDFVLLFDVELVEPDGRSRIVATQSLEGEAPGTWLSALYPVPLAWTRARDAVTIRFRPKGLEGRAGRGGRLFARVESLTLDV